MLANALSGCALVHSGTPAVRILVLNMHAGKTATSTDNLDAVGALIRSSDANLVLLQEVDRGSARSGHVDQVARLQEMTKYGIAVLSREEIGYSSTVPLPVKPVETRAGGSHEPRVAQALFFDVHGAVWRAVNTHLDPVDGDSRAQEVAALLGVVREEKTAGTPLVVGGDFNSTPDDPVMRPLQKAGLRDSWVECGQGDGLTYPADNPVKRIDYLFLGGNVRCISAQVLDVRVSDHRPLLVTIR